MLAARALLLVLTVTACTNQGLDPAELPSNVACSGAVAGAACDADDQWCSSTNLPLGAGGEQLARLLGRDRDADGLPLGACRALVAGGELEQVRHELLGRRVTRRLNVEMDECGTIA